jgi:DNA-binding LacI/PurR family transcriptional regulator
MNKRPTISDVARLAGVSLMSVSRALNDRPGLGEATRQRILRIADEIGFRPSQIARGLATQRTSTVGLVMPDVANPFFAQIARGAEDAAYENGYSVFLINTAEDVERERAALDSLWQKQIDGAILCSPRLTLDELKPRIMRFPAAVLVNRELDRPILNISAIG